MLAVTSNRFNTQVYKLFKLAVKPECLQKAAYCIGIAFSCDTWYCECRQFQLFGLAYV